MSRNLSDINNSARVEARNKFRKNPVIEVYVENEDDIPFWKHLFLLHQLDVKIYPAVKSIKRLERGKTTVLKKANQAGKFLLLCVDSDYDYLLQNKVLANPYIFQTYSYSFENHLCNPEEMKMMCIRSVLVDEIEFDFEAFFRQYSELIYPLFLCHLSYRALGQAEVFPLSSFLNAIDFPDKFKITDVFTKILPKIGKNIAQKIKELQTNHPIESTYIIQKEVEWQQLGLQSVNSHQFIQGHFLFDTTVKLLNQICYLHKKAKINNFNQSVQERNDENIRKKEIKMLKMKINEYENQVTPIDVILKLNTSFQNSALWKKIHLDFVEYKNNK